MKRYGLFTLSICLAVLFVVGCDEGGKIGLTDSEMTEAPTSGTPPPSSPTQSIGTVCDPSAEAVAFPACLKLLPLDADIVFSISPSRINQSKPFMDALGEEIGKKVAEAKQLFDLPYADLMADISSLCGACVLKKGGALKQTNKKEDGGSKQTGNPFEGCEQYGLVADGTLSAAFNLEKFLTQFAAKANEGSQDPPFSFSASDQAGIYTITITDAGVTHQYRFGTVGGKLVFGTPEFVQTAATANASEYPQKVLWDSVPEAAVKGVWDVEHMEWFDVPEVSAMFNTAPEVYWTALAVDVTDKLCAVAKGFTHKDVTNPFAEAGFRINVGELKMDAIKTLVEKWNSKSSSSTGKMKTGDNVVSKCKDEFVETKEGLDKKYDDCKAGAADDEGKQECKDVYIQELDKAEQTYKECAVVKTKDGKEIPKK